MIERRSGSDRRGGATFPLRFSGQRRRRSKGRRETDRGGYVDYYDVRSWGIALSVMILSLTDAVLTGAQVRHGSVHEINPVMDAVIRLGGIYSFLSLKAGMTALPLAIIMLHKEWRLGRYAARICLWSYIIVVTYHIYLLIEYKSLAGFQFSFH
ncbi:MAG TPA: DUF5658 family protein [Acidobacteriota bacterium]|nr:DUF5658 family protein [Acidobacteriota bacterium]